MSNSTEPVAWPRGLYRSFINPTLIGSNFSLILFGCSLVQVMNVYRLLAERGQGIKSRSWWIVSLLFWVNLTDTAIKFQGVIGYTEGAVFKGSALLSSPLPPVLIPTPAFLGIVAGYVQCLYIYRIIRLTKGMQSFDSFQRPAKVVTYSILCICAVLILVSEGGFIYYCTILSRPPLDWFPDIKIAGILCLGGASTVDVLLCLCLVYHLKKHQTKSHHKNTNFLAGRLMRLTFETGLAPAVGQIIELLFLIVTPNTGNWTAMGLLMAKVYVCSALVVYESMLSIKNPTSSGGVGNSHSGNDRIGPIGVGRPRITQTNDITSMGSHIHDDFLRARERPDDLERKVHLSEINGLDSQVELELKSSPKSEKTLKNSSIWVQEETRTYTS